MWWWGARGGWYDSAGRLINAGCWPARMVSGGDDGAGLGDDGFGDISFVVGECARRLGSWGGSPLDLRLRESSGRAMNWPDSWLSRAHWPTGGSPLFAPHGPRRISLNAASYVRRIMHGRLVSAIIPQYSSLRRTLLLCKLAPCRHTAAVRRRINC